MVREPVRTCVGCREKAEPASMVRVARSVGGQAAVGRTVPGRGAWMHPGCLEEALRKGRLSRALRGGLSEGEIATLRNDIGTTGAT